MQQELTMGSLFSGSGGFELASAIFGIEPRWASEIEPLPMLITKKNFPDMPHHGDIRYMNGGSLIRQATQDFIRCGATESHFHVPCL